jgi:hypothetical protein
MRFFPAQYTTLSLLPLLWLLFSFQTDDPAGPQVKEFALNGRTVKVTHQVEQVFYGKYQGEKAGYLLLDKDGTGEYLYDIQYPARDCATGIIHFEWGFLLDENNQVVRFERDYGYSYPVILYCTGENCFQSCRVEYMVEYILDKKQGRLEVSSSDDWVKITR